MEIKNIKRPWQNNTRQGTRYNPDPYYQSIAWRNNRSSFRNGHTDINGFKLSNKYCVDCFKESGRFIPGKNTDHIEQRKAGGSDEHTNLQTQCDTHHARKSANEGKKSRKKI